MAMRDEIRTDRLLLRPIQASDAETMFTLRSDPELAQFQGWEPPTLDAIRALIAEQQTRPPDQPGWSQLAMVEVATGTMLGGVAVRILDSDRRQAEIGITLARHAQRRGYATEAVRAVLGDLFSRREIHRVTASVDPQNTRSIALLNRLGFRREAHHVESLWIRGAWVDDVIFAMLRREWPLP
jgi:RimJ/RimL family protein N-acetyltransferase